MKQLWLVVFVCTLGLGCGGQSEPGVATGSVTALKIAFVTNNASDFWKIAEAGTRKAKAELGCEVLFRIPPNGTAQEQKEILQDLVTVGVSGIAISPKDPANQTEILNDIAAKVHLITQDSDAPKSNRLAYVGTDNYDAGRAAGQLIRQTLPDGGKVMLFVGTLDAQNAQDRKRGIEDVLAGTSITIVDTRTDETDRLKAKANAQDALITHPDLACLVGLWSYNGPVILSGVRDAGRLGEVRIICFDEEEDTLQGIKDGHIAGTIVQQPFEFGYQSVRVLTALANGDTGVVPESRKIIIPVRTITRDNVDSFRAELKKITGRG